MKLVKIRTIFALLLSSSLSSSLMFWWMITTFRDSTLKGPNAWEVPSEKRQTFRPKTKSPAEVEYRELMRLKRVFLRGHYYHQGTNKTNTTPCMEDLRLNRCEVIHIAVVCAGETASRQVATLVKSILFHSCNPVHFHFISDTFAHKDLTDFFQTSAMRAIPAVSTSFYSIENEKDKVSWIPNKHYSGIFGLMKLILTEALPQSLDKVVVLDTDILFASDIAELWRIFDQFTGKTAIGLVENQSEWYLNKSRRFFHVSWPALGRGFNTGLILLDLYKMRQMNWNALWIQIAEKELRIRRKTYLADQDIFNTVIKSHPDLVWKLPCAWNVQLAYFIRRATCYKDSSEIKVIHWNSDIKWMVGNKYEEFLGKLRLPFLEMNHGNFSRQWIFPCNESDNKIRQVTDGGLSPN